MKKNLIKNGALFGTLLLAGLSSCGAAKIKINPDKQHYNVNVVQIVAHDALDFASNGFKDKLEQLLSDEGRTVTVRIDKADGTTSVVSQYISNAISSDTDLIIANATPVLQIAANATKTIPVLGTSVTEYGTALGIKNFNGVIGNNISGTSDLAPLEDQAQIMCDLLPGKTNIGILYCSSEANSEYQVKEIKKKLQGLGKTVTEYKFNDSNDLSMVCTTAANNSDALYVPTDNTAAENASIINNVCTTAGKPVFAGEESICKNCGFATLSISYKALGEKTAEMAKEILLGQKDITKYAIQYDANPVKKYNGQKCKALGITIPSDQGFVVIEGTEVTD